MNIAHVSEKDKRIRSLNTHSETVSAYATLFASKIDLSAIADVSGLLHDLGKATDIFQRYVSFSAGLIDESNPLYLHPGKCKGKIDHAVGGAKLLDYYPETDQRIRLLLQEVIVSLTEGCGLFWNPMEIISFKC